MQPVCRTVSGVYVRHSCAFHHAPPRAATTRRGNVTRNPRPHDARRPKTAGNASVPLACSLRPLRAMTISARARRSLAIVMTAGLACAGCGGESAPATPEARLQKGKDVIQHMSDTLEKAQAFSVTTRETREQAKVAGGQPVPVTLTRQTIVRRPDRLYFKTTGDNDNEAWYDGIGLTYVAHKDKVFAQARMPETLDRTLDAMSERYNIQVPLADLLYSKPAHALISDTTTGGWTGKEAVDGQDCDHVAFEDRGIKWEMWVAPDGLPRRAKAEFPATRRLRRADVTFSDWNLSPTIDAKRFEPAVPADYEGIAMIQRAAILRNNPDEAVPTGGKK